MMEGRSDNMILCRHRKLTEWKEKCEWLEKQDVSKILLVKQKSKIDFYDNMKCYSKFYCSCW